MRLKRFLGIRLLGIPIKLFFQDKQGVFLTLPRERLGLILLLFKCMLAMWLLFITRRIFRQEKWQGCFTNYRPVANIIPFLANVIGRLSRGSNTLILGDVKDVCNPPTVNIMLALSAAFDTVDHTILLGRLSGYFGFSHIVLKLVFVLSYGSRSDRICYYW